MRLTPMAVLMLCTGCMQGQPDPDAVGIGPIPDTVAAIGADEDVVLQADRKELNCLMREVQIALAQAPETGQVVFNGVRTCKIAAIASP